MDGETEILKGRVCHITYKNEQNGYTVFKISVGGEEIVSVGNFPFISLGDTVSLKGKYIVHPVYGPQFAADECERETPSTTAAILRYLSSGAIKGIGPATAQRLVQRFGKKTLDIIKDSPKRLAEMRGISPEKAQKISEEYKKQFSLQDLMFFLSAYKITPEETARVYKMLGDGAVERLKENPYLLCMEGIGFPFERVDDIAESLGISEGNTNRTFAGIEYILRHNLLNGHTCLPRKRVCELGASFLGCSVEDVEDAADIMINNGIIVLDYIDDTEFLFLPIYHSADRFIASKLAVLVSYGSKATLDELEIDYIENRLHIKYEALQRKVIELAFSGGVTVLTGGPGTGKTTTLNGIIELFEQKNLKVSLAAPTGRAAKRISELTGREAKTIHRLLEVQWGEGDKPYFNYNERNHLKCDVLIVDEMSMVDTLLFESLLRAVRLGTKLILVGDADQLPSVSAGNVLHDIIESGRIPSVTLNKIFRQSNSGLIVHNAHEIISGRMPNLDCKDADFFMIETTSSKSAAQTVVDLATERLPKAYGFSSFEDIQILCPSRKLELGTVNLNQILQDAINPAGASSPVISHGGFSFREEDKVMQIKNNYDICWTRDDGEQGSGVFNGDIGRIEKIDNVSQLVTVRFDDRVASYYGTDISQLEPAYAVTVHKSQGCEFDCVILPLLNIQSQLTYRNLLYTAVTRAKRIIVIVGDRKTVRQMVENDRKTLRYSGLKKMIEDVFDA